MGLCIALGAKTIAIAATSFTLSWTHSAQKTEWQEYWEIAGNGLNIAEARVQGSGAGMEPPEGAVLSGRWWVYRPRLPQQKQIVLAASGATTEGWLLCAASECHRLGDQAAQPIVIKACSRP